MNRVAIKPISVNECWRGRRFKTRAYEDFEKAVSYLLPRQISIPEGKLTLNIVFGYSSKASDADNSLKPFIDILQKHYGFNDKRIYRIIADKVDVKKGQEYIEFALSEHLT